MCQLFGGKVDAMHDLPLQDASRQNNSHSGEPGAAQGDGKTLDSTLSKIQVHATDAASFDFNLGPLSSGIADNSDVDFVLHFRYYLVIIPVLFYFQKIPLLLFLLRLIPNSCSKKIPY